jgi:hypothetical protein
MPSPTDLGPFLKWVACFPGNYIVHLFTDTWPRIGNFLEITHRAPFGEPAWGFSILFWLAALFILTELVATPRRRKAKAKAAPGPTQ